ncbi:MAG TPA: Hsp20/alpha crystallin family protein [Pyrinomonadaceae bacterium]|jgi:HSP20 family protein
MGQHWDPIRDLVTLQDRMNRLFEDAAHKRSRGEEGGGEREIEQADWYPAADVYNRETEYLIMVDLPGIERDALEISLDDNRLTIGGLRSLAEEENMQRVERPHGRFLRRFGVPATVDQKAITAEYKDGVLRLRLPKLKEQKARRVEIKVS